MDNYNIFEPEGKYEWHGALRNERFVSKCLQKIHSAKNAEDGLVSLLEYLGQSLNCQRVYVFEEMDRQHIQNTYEWCREGVSSGIKQLPYIAKKDLNTWYDQLTNGINIIQPYIDSLKESEPFIYEIMKNQSIDSIILSPLMLNGKFYGLLGADNPPPEYMWHISVLLDVIAYFVCSLVSQRELSKLRDLRGIDNKLDERALKYCDKSILLVDDSSKLLNLNKRILKQDGYQVDCALSLQEAKKLIDQKRFDLIIMDVDLTDGNGISFCRELNCSKKLPIIFLTAHCDVQTIQESEAAGGNAFLTKPYDMEELQRAVAAALENKK